MRHDGLSRRHALQLGAAACSLGISTARAQTAEVKVALLVPLSGPWARQGELMRDGAQMAVDDVNAAGGVRSLGGARMRLLTFDAGDSAEKARSAAQRMVAQEPDLVGGSGAWLSSFTLAVTEVTERAELPWLTESYSNLITGRGFHYVFQTAMTAQAQSDTTLPVMLDLAKSAGSTVTRMGILADNTASTVSFLGRVREVGLPKASVKLVLDETYTPPMSDVTSLVQRIRSSRPQLLFLGVSNVSDTKLMLDKMSEFGLGHGKVPTFGAGGAMSAAEMLGIVGKDQLEGLMVIVANFGGKGQEALVKRFTDRTKEPWMGQDSIQTYFEMMLLKEAVEKAGVAERHKVADALRSFDISGGIADLLPGGRVKFDDSGRLVDADLVIIQWQDGIPVPIYPAHLASGKAEWPRT